jgi:hypothetical protein
MRKAGQARRLLKNLAEATSEAQDAWPFPLNCPKALFAGCAVNLFFNKALEVTLPPLSL